MHETAQKGLPRPAVWFVGLSWFVCAGLAVMGYLATHAWIVAGVFGGIAFLVTIGVANAAQLMHRGNAR